MSVETRDYSFRTDRLRCEPLTRSSAGGADGPARTVAAILNMSDTDALPPAWRGQFSIERAQAWIDQRETDSTPLLVSGITNNESIGVVVIAEDPGNQGDATNAARSELRIGYVLRRDHSGLGLGTELVNGIVEWARAQPSVGTLLAGVDRSNTASVRVLEKAGFVSSENSEAGTDEMALYRVGVDDVWAEAAADWDQEPHVRAYASAAFESLGELLARLDRSLRYAQVLDFGCGTGLLTEKLAAAGASVVAIDTSQAMLAVLKAKEALMETGRVRVGTSLPPAGEEFDLVVCSSVCSFLPDYPGTAVELAERLAPNGLFVQWDWERVPGEDGGLSRDDIAAALTDAGLVDVDISIGFAIDVDGAHMAPLLGHGRRPAV